MRGFTVDDQRITFDYSGNHTRGHVADLTTGKYSEGNVVEEDFDIENEKKKAKDKRDEPKIKEVKP